MNDSEANCSQSKKKLVREWRLAEDKIALQFWLHLSPFIICQALGGGEGGWGGGSEAWMPKLKVNINRLKWNFAWVIIFIKVFLMQNVSLLTLLVLEIWSHKISLGRRERVIKFGYLPPENGFKFKNMTCYVRNGSSPSKIDLPGQFRLFQTEENLFIFKILGTSRWEKSSIPSPWLINFAKIWSENVLRIKSKICKVWASWSKTFVIGSFEFACPDLWAPSPRPDTVKSLNGK